LLNRKCLYSVVFEKPLPEESSRGARISGPPNPFVIEPPLNTDIHFQEGSSFDFNLLLFGDVNHSIPYFIYAFEQMGKIGIGRRLNGKRGLFKLESVMVGDKPVYNSSERKLRAGDTFEHISLLPADLSPQESFRLKVNMVTPMRLKFENRLKADLPFHVLVRAMLRRVSSLFECYGEGEPELDYRGLVKRSEEIRIVEDSLRWYDWRRYSFRQEQSMLMGGMVGSITYEGKIGEYMPLVDLCSKVHLGKQTSFGLGKMKAEKVS